MSSVHHHSQRPAPPIGAHLLADLRIPPAAGTAERSLTLLTLPPPAKRENHRPSSSFKSPEAAFALLALGLVGTAAGNMIFRGFPLQHRKNSLALRVIQKLAGSKAPFSPLIISSWFIGTVNSAALAGAGLVESYRTSIANIVPNTLNITFLAVSLLGLYVARKYQESQHHSSPSPVKFSKLEKGCIALAFAGIGMVGVACAEQAGLANLSKHLGLPVERLSAYAGMLNVFVGNIPYLATYLKTCSWENVRGVQDEPPRLQQILFFGAALTGVIGMPFSSITDSGFVVWTRVLISALMLTVALSTGAIYQQRLRRHLSNL